jgi:hypothetical protein
MQPCQFADMKVALSDREHVMTNGWLQTARYLAMLLGRAEADFLELGLVLGCAKVDSVVVLRTQLGTRAKT